MRAFFLALAASLISFADPITTCSVELDCEVFTDAALGGTATLGDGWFTVTGHTGNVSAICPSCGEVNVTVSVELQQEFTLAPIGGTGLAEFAFSESDSVYDVDGYGNGSFDCIFPQQVDKSLPFTVHLRIYGIGDVAATGYTSFSSWFVSSWRIVDVDVSSDPPLDAPEPQSIFLALSGLGSLVMARRVIAPPRRLFDRNNAYCD